MEKNYMVGLATGLLMVCQCGTSSSTLIDADFATSGDGLLILDTVNNREWVDVAKTTGMSVNEFFSTSIFSGQGFQLATEADLDQFYTEPEQQTSHTMIPH